MQTFIKNNKLFIFLSLIIFIGGFFRFYKLDWASGLFTHPDEYHIVRSVSQLSYPNQMHPHFFSYGTVTIYLIYFTQEILKYLSSTFHLPFFIFNSFLVGRFYSALFSTLTIIIVYKICRSFMEKRFSYLAALLTALTPGLIQQAHFATPESAQTFFLFSSLLFMIKFIQHSRSFYLVLAAIALGFAIGTKISSIVFLLPIVLSIILSASFKRHSGLSRISNHLGDSGCAAAYQNDAGDFRSFRKLFRLIILIPASLLTTLVTFALTAPFVFLDFPAFRSNLEYEGGLAVGKFPVFYTRQFINTLPILFQIEKILPYALGPSLFLFSVLGFILILINIIKKPKIELIIIIISFLSLFIPNAFLFAKWTRFIAPTFPFFAIFAAFSLRTFATKMQRSFYYFLVGILVFGTSFWTMSFFSIYINRDIRITASWWLEMHAKPGSSFLVEGGNMIDIPLAGNFRKTSLSFYDLEDDLMTRERIINGLHSSDYFLVQSRRVFMNHQRLPTMYPKTAKFYDKLFNRELGFKQIKEFHSYPSLEIACPPVPGCGRRGNWKLEIADESAEETWSVFDHPVIRVFKKIMPFSKENYGKFFEN